MQSINFPAADQIECGYEQEQQRYAEALAVAMTLSPARRLELAHELEINDPAYQAWCEAQAAEFDSMPVQSDAVPCNECGAPVDDPFDSHCENCNAHFAEEFAR